MHLSFANVPKLAQCPPQILLSAWTLPSAVDTGPHGRAPVPCNCPPLPPITQTPQVPKKKQLQLVTLALERKGGASCSLCGLCPGLGSSWVTGALAYKVGKVQVSWFLPIGQFLPASRERERRERRPVQGAECLWPSEFLFCNLIPNVMVSGGKAFGRGLGHKSGLLVYGIRALMKETSESCTLPSATWGHEEESAICNLEGGSFQVPNRPEPWSWTRHPPELRNRLGELEKPPSRWYFVTAAWMHPDSYITRSGLSGITWCACVCTAAPLRGHPRGVTGSEAGMSGHRLNKGSNSRGAVTEKLEEPASQLCLIYLLNDHGCSFLVPRASVLISNVDLFLLFPIHVCVPAYLCVPRRDVSKVLHQTRTWLFWEFGKWVAFPYFSLHFFFLN